MYVVKPVYQFQGLDLTSSDKARPEEKASEWLNGELDLSGKQRKRNGSQTKASVNGGFGLISFRRVNPLTRQEENELLAIGEEDLLRYAEASMVVTYSGSAVVVTANLLLESGNFYFRIVADGVQLCNVNLGTGLELAPVSIATLTSTVDALADITATASGTTTVPAAFLDVTEDYDLKSAALTVKAASFTAVNTRGLIDVVKSKVKYFQSVEEFINPCNEQLNDCLYIAAGNLLKYDGQTLFYAGLSTPQFSLNPTAVAATAVGAGVYQVKARVVHVDNVGNRIISDWTPTVSVTLAGGQGFSIFNSDWLTGLDSLGIHSAKVNGLQSSVSTVTVDAGHLLEVGDRVYFYDSASSAFVEAIVSATTATTITLDGRFDGLQTWDFANNSEISTHRIEFCRTQAGGSDVFYLADEFPAVGNGSTGQAYISTTANGSEIAEITEPAYPPSFPPECKFVTKWQNSLVVGGQPYSTSMLDTAVDAERIGSEIRWNDIEFAEGFPEVHSLSFDTTLGDKISGLKEVNDALIVGKDQSIHRVNGNLGLLQLSTEVITTSEGVASHHSMQDVDGVLFYLSENGVRALQSSGLPRSEIGMPIEKAFISSALAKRRAIAINYKTDQKYILFVPSEGGTAVPTFEVPGIDLGDGGGTITPDQTIPYLYANSGSRCFVFDTFRKSWREWSGVDYSGGLCVHEDKLWGLSRTYSSAHSAVKYYASRELKSGSKRDKNDHNLPINWQYSTAWIHLGQPKIAKQFLRLALSSVHEYANNNFAVTVTQQVNFLDANKASISVDCSNSSLGTSAHTRVADGKFYSSRFIFENAVESQDIEIDGWELEIASPLKPGLRT